MEFATYIATHIATCVATEWLPFEKSCVKPRFRVSYILIITGLILGCKYHFRPIRRIDFNRTGQI